MNENESTIADAAGLIEPGSPVKTPADVPVSSDETNYRAHGVTVWFETMPEKNPFKIVSEYGEARSIGRGNSFDEADIYREALEAIMEVRGYGKEYELAEAALEKVNEAQMAGLKKAKPSVPA
jgi:hypothetical protein